MSKYGLLSSLLSPLYSPCSLLPFPFSLQTMKAAFWLLVLQMSCTDLRRQLHLSLLLLLIPLRTISQSRQSSQIPMANCLWVRR